MPSMTTDFALWLLGLGVVLEDAAATDAELVHQAREDLTAFQPLYERHVQRVYRYLLARVGNVHDAQDLTSQTFIAAMESLSAYHGGHPFPAWLLGIARHKAADHFRRKRPLAGLEAALDKPDGRTEPDEAAGQRLQIRLVARKLHTLAPDRAEALRLRFFAGLEVEAIAIIMAKNTPAVRMLVHRGLKNLQRQLQPAMEEQP